MRARAYLLFRQENPAPDWKEWNQKVWIYDSFYPKPLRRFCTKGEWRVIGEGCRP